MNIDMPPEVRPLPNHEQHRRDLLAAIRAESGAGSESWSKTAHDGVPRRAGLLRGSAPGRAGVPRKSAGRPPWLNPAWMGPAAAGAAVLVVVAAAVAVHGLVRTGSGSPGRGSLGAGQTRQVSDATGSASTRTTGPGTSVAGTVPLITKPTLAPGGQWEITSSFDVTSSVTSLAVDDPTGSVTVTAGDTSSVSVTAVVHYATTAPFITRKITSGSTLSLGYSDCGDCGVGFRVTVPSGTNVEVTGGVGGITLTGIHGSVDVRTNVGNVTATGLTGPHDQFRVGTGRIGAAFASPPSRIDAETGTGSVMIHVPSSATYRVSASAGLGAANVSVPQAADSGHVITAETSTGSVSVTG